MKKFLLVTGMLMVLTACQKDEGTVSDTAATSSFTVTVPQREVPTRAVTDAFGTGMSVNRCILEIYRDGTLYNRIEKSVDNRTVTFDNLRLVAQHTYDFVFWADCAGGSEGNFTDLHYNTQSLKAISNRGTFEGCSDERDAFFAKKSFEVTGSFTEPVTLTRPFGLLVVKTNDLDEIKDEALKPTGYTVTFKNMPDTFNALTGEISGSGDISYTADDLAKVSDGTVSMDFLWADDTEAALSDFTVTFLNNGTAICTNDAFTNIPIRRNYRTNVSGNLLTKQGTINVTVDPEFDPESPVEKVIVEVANAAEVKEALENGATDIIVKTLSSTEANEIVIPQIYPVDNNMEISLTLPETGEDVTIQYDGSASGTGSNTEAPAIIAITANTTGKTTINTPESTVILSGSFGEIDATTADNTLIVPEDVTVGSLTVKGGNVVIYGVVNNLAEGEGYDGVITQYVSNAEALESLFANSACVDKAVLLKDIAAENGVCYTVDVAADLTFDLNGRTLAGSSSEASHFAFITNKGNLTIDDSKGGGKISYDYNGASSNYGMGWGNYTIDNRNNSLTINGGTIENISDVTAHMIDAIDNYAGEGDATITINGGIVACPTYVAIRLFVTSDNYANKIVMNDGAVVGGSTSFYLQNLQPTGVLDINGGELTGDIYLDNSNVAYDLSVENVIFYVKNGSRLIAALKNANRTCSVVLLNDIEVTADATIEIPSGNAVNLDLAGYTLSSTNTRTATHNDFILVKGTLNVENGTIKYEHTGTNMGWNGCTNLLNVTAGGILNMKEVSANNCGGTDMNFAVHMNNWGEVTLNADKCKFIATYCGVRVFNSGYDDNNVIIRNSELTGLTRAFWVHNYIGDLNSDSHSDDAVKERLKIDIYNNGNTFTATSETRPKSPIRYGYNSAIYFDAEGIQVQ
ncbi:MAG: hypothetical protein IJC16_05780 [Rikenellaceae bacterium]|nr:hypothetical protein [Rikenellaceae bacterium]